MAIKVKRAYENASNEDGIRVLVDRLWPRGVSKEKLKLDVWMKEVSPSKDLCKWFNHEPAKFVEFAMKYKEELKQGQLEKLVTLILESQQDVTLVYGAKDEQHNQAIVLQEILTQQVDENRHLPTN